MVDYVGPGEPSATPFMLLQGAEPAEPVVEGMEVSTFPTIGASKAGQPPLGLEWDSQGCPIYHPALCSSVEVVRIWNESFDLGHVLDNADADRLLDGIEFQAMRKSMSLGRLQQMSLSSKRLAGGATLSVARVIDYLDRGKVRRSFIAIGAECDDESSEGCRGGFRHYSRRPSLLPIPFPYTAKEAGPEDARVFTDDSGSPHLLFNMGQQDGSRRMWLYNLTDDAMHQLLVESAGPISRPGRVPVGPIIEKNWTPVELRGRTLDLVYRFHPLQMVRCEVARGETVCRQLQGPTLKDKYPNPIMRGGTPFLPLERHPGFFIAFARTQVVYDGCCRGEKGFYRPHLILLHRDQAGVYRVVYASEPLDFRDAIWRFSKQLSAEPPYTKEDGCDGVQRIIIPISIVTAEEDKDSLVLSFCVDDRFGVLVLLSGVFSFIDRIISAYREALEGSWLDGDGVVGCVETSLAAYCDSPERPWRKPWNTLNRENS